MTSIPSSIQALLDDGPIHTLYDALIDKQIDKTLPSSIQDIADIMATWGELRLCEWPQEWYTRKKIPAATPLARKLRLPPRTPNALQKFMAQLALHTAQTMPPLTHLEVKQYPHATPIPMAAHEATLLWDKLALTPLAHVEIDSGETGSALIATLHAATLPHLQTLTLRAGIPDAQLAAILSAPGLSPLQELTLEVGALGPQAAQALAQRHSATLARLTLIPHAWGGGASLPDLWSASWPALTHLAVAMRHAAPDSLRRALDAAPALTNLTWRSPAPLDLASLHDAPERALTRLWLHASPSDAQSAAILASPAMRGVHDLLLRGSADLGPQSASAIRALHRLAHLDLYDTPQPCPTFWTAMRDASFDALASLELGWSQHHMSGALETLATWHVPAIQRVSFSTLHMDAHHLALIEAIPWLGQCAWPSEPRLDTQPLKDRWRSIITAAQARHAAT